MKNEKKLTKEELLEMESTPKTKAQEIMDVIICFLPLVAAAVMFAVYYLAPNKAENKNPHLFTGVVCVFLVIYVIHLIQGFFNKSRFQKVRYKAPLNTAIILLIMGYDCLTLKTGTLPLPFFPWINSVLNAIVEDRVLLLTSTLSSLKLLFTGYFLGAALGLVTGITCGYNDKVHYWVNPIIKLLGPIPSTTWIPIVMVICTSLFKGSAFIIGLGVWFSVTIASLTGISNVDKSYLEAARTLGAKSYQMVFRVAIPHALPSIFQGLIQGMSSACTALLVAEMIGSKAGLGWYITWQKSWAIYAKMYAAIVLICLIFTAVTYLLNLAKRIVLRWQEGVVK